jgi:hypothetical protein
MNQIRCLELKLILELVNHSVIYVTVKANDENSCFLVEGMTGDR